MEANDAGGQTRRSLRVKLPTGSGGGAPAANTLTVADAESPRSDAASSTSRSSRLSNPEFAAKRQAFMAKVTAAHKGSMDTYLTSEMIVGDSVTAAPSTSGTGSKRKGAKTDSDSSSVKRRRSTRTNSSGLDVHSDCYCWICHKEGEVICCEACPRVFHVKCLSLEANPSEDWVCPECVLIMSAENMETRSRAMRLLTVDQLCTLLRHALNRIKTITNIEPFLKPVDPLQFPAYKDYISCPMDLQSMERNIRRKQYGSTEALLADCKWILHNCIIFNSMSSKLTGIAKNIVKICKHEMQEIENCPDCYLNAHVKKDVWFTEACRLPHPLVWAKLKGFPFWPGKVMRVTTTGNCDIRFFGAHDRAWIPLKDVFLYSKKSPADIKKKRGNLDLCFKEMEQHIKKLKDKFGMFEYAPHKCRYDPAKELEMLKTLFPNYVPPFDIGTVTRRRTYSFTGSERSRDATPTPSELSAMDEEEEQEEEEGDEEEEEIVPTEEGVEKKTEINNSSPKHTPCGPSATLLQSDKGEGVQKIIIRGLKTLEKPEVAELELSTKAKEIVKTAQPEPDLTKAEPEPEQKPMEVKPPAEEPVKEDSQVAEKEESDPPPPAAAPEKENLEREASSPPCEVSSTTRTPGPAELEEKEKESDEKEKEAEEEEDNDAGKRLVEGVVADESGEKVVFEDEEMEEIDDVEPSLDNSKKEDAEKPSEIQDEAQNNPVEQAETEAEAVQENAEEPAVNDDKEDKNKEKNTEDDLSITLTKEKEKNGTEDKKKVEKRENKDKEDDQEQSDLSVTIVEKSKAEDSNKSNRISIRKEEDLVQNTENGSAAKKKAPSTATEDNTPDPIITISKVSKDNTSSSGPSRISETRRSQSSAGSAPTPPAASSSPFSAASLAQKMHSLRGGPPPMGPRGPMLMGPNAAASMMRGSPFRGGPSPAAAAHSSLGGMPNLQPRPVGPLSLPPGLPSAAGPVAQQINKVAKKLSDYLKTGLQDMFTNVPQSGSSDATIKALKVECERMAWRHQQELAEMKHNADIIIMEMRGTMEQEKQRALMDCRKQAELDRQKAVSETKKKQWCANCGKEAIFYCCWNTSYCDYPCQQAHWPSHMATCAQNNSEPPEEEMHAVPQTSLSHHYMSAASSRMAMQQHLGGHPHQSRNQHHTRMPASMAGMRYGMRPSLPGQMNYSRPYFM